MTVAAACVPTAPRASRGEPLIDPVVEYSHRQIGTAVVGGYRYRGAAIPALRGQYVFGDYSAEWTGETPEPRGSLVVAQPSDEAGASWEWRRLLIAEGPLEQFVTGMGEDGEGELYVMTRRTLGPTGSTGAVRKIVRAG